MSTTLRRPVGDVQALEVLPGQHLGPVLVSVQVLLDTRDVPSVQDPGTVGVGAGLRALRVASAGTLSWPCDISSPVVQHVVAEQGERVLR